MNYDMKKMFMAVIALMMTISASAQFYIYCSDGNVIKVDSISMIAPSAGIGTFSVSSSKQVSFSKGNLLYHPANNEWRFAESQLDYIGADNSNISSSIIQHYMPSGIGETDIASLDNFVDKYILKRGALYDYKSFIRRVSVEQEMSKYVTNWIGRTEWDKASAYCLNPNAKYYHCDELMRKEFYEHQWEYHYDGKLIIQSSISNALYKGLGVVLRTAKTLKSLGVNFEWNVYGVTASSSTVRFFAKKYNIKPKDVNVRLLGYVNAATIVEGLLKSDVYVHPSLIENSCNAVQEAMCLGTPAISQCVGGVKTTLASDAGILVQPNDASVMAYSILQMRDQGVAEEYSKRGRSVAMKRHNRELVVADLVMAYKKIING